MARHSGGIIDWTKEELQDMGRKTRNIMTLNRCLHPRSSMARSYEGKRRRERTHKCGGLYSKLKGDDCMTT